MEYKILVVDDDRSITNLLQTELEQAGYAVSVAHDGNAAIAKNQTEQPDLIIMDVMMPVMDGLEATKAIRMLEREDAKKIPIIAMTANAFEEDRKACLDAGMDEHIGKPIDIPLLKRTITKLLTKNHKNRIYNETDINI